MLVFEPPWYFNQTSIARDNSQPGSLDRESVGTPVQQSGTVRPADATYDGQHQPV
jgi:hypothetical protein